MTKQPTSPPENFQMVREFLRLESAGGLLLMGATALALIVANSPLAWLYDELLALPFEIRLGRVHLGKPLLLWINDGWMAIFFLLIGLELKREVLEGELSSKEQVMLPAVAALGGVLAPVAVYWFINSGDPSAMNGWAIPTATDIAFALGILSLLGSRVPLELKLFLTAVAIVDDLVAIMIIAVFYTSDLSLIALELAGLGLLFLFILNRFNVNGIAVYLIVGWFIWAAVLKSGVHATLAGVAVAMAIPLRTHDDESPARHLEHILHPWVAFLILPTFAFANAGVRLIGIDFDVITGTVLLGIALGLFVGKQLGVFGLVWLAVKLGLANLPKNCNWRHMYGAALLAGIGFTMSLFIGTLAFEHGDFGNITATRLGVLLGSLLSGVVGVAVLMLSGKGPEEGPEEGVETGPESGPKSGE